MIDPQSAYLIAKAGLETGRVAYAEADKRVAAYAEREGISKDEAWALVREEAVRRGDDALTAAADYVMRHPVQAHGIAAVVPGGQIAVAGVYLRKWFKNRT